MRRWRKVWCLFAFSLICGIYVGSAIIYFTSKCFNLKVRTINVDLDSSMKRGLISNDSAKRDSVNDDFLFVGVMTDRKFLDTRAKAINLTWAHRVKGKVLFFVGEGEPYKGDLSVVELKGVSENAYPPQKKSFAMLEYMGRHYASRYKT